VKIRKAVGLIALGALVALAGCQETAKKAGAAGSSSRPKTTDYFSCSSDSDCVVEKQKDCCPCNAGGRQIALRKGALEDYRAARAARCQGDLLCPQVYLCNDAARAVCVARRCELAGGSGPVPIR
jgi:hypothetical protein